MPFTPPDVLAVLPPPFEWCEVQYEKPVKLEIGEWENFQYVIKAVKTMDGALTLKNFWMAKYPITNQQYKIFLDAPDGYANIEWWQPLATLFSESLSTRIANPTPIDIPRDNDRPATHVSFYDALAFSVWLQNQLFSINRNLFGIGLPEEYLWQKAAQGDDERLYPWGNEFDISRANTRESNIVKTTPVTDYPDGASPYGVMDMSGNVWEWCMDTAVTMGQAVLRGGSWRFDARFATTTYRYFYEPDQGHGNIGFRIMGNIKG